MHYTMHYTILGHTPWLEPEVAACGGGCEGRRLAIFYVQQVEPQALGARYGEAGSGSGFGVAVLLGATGSG